MLIAHVFHSNVEKYKMFKFVFISAVKNLNKHNWNVAGYYVE